MTSSIAQTAVYFDTEIRRPNRIRMSLNPPKMGPARFRTGQRLRIELN